MIGHEIDFEFDNKACSALNTLNGWALWVEGECIFLEPDLDVFLEYKAFGIYSVRDILEQELYKPKSLIIF